jgi:erythromycin esterase
MRIFKTQIIITHIFVFFFKTNNFFRFHVFFFFIVALTCKSLSAQIKENQEDNNPHKIIKEHALHILDDGSLDTLVALAKNKKIVLLGESTHGTHEYYYWRDRISRRLIAEHDFDFVLVEGDWASLFRLNMFVKGMSNYVNATEVVQTFNRWPQWMWRNSVIVDFATWLKNHNLQNEKKTGFYGMDVYDEWTSFNELMSFLDTQSDKDMLTVKNLIFCMSQFMHNSWQYAYAVSMGLTSCAPSLKKAYGSLKLALEKRPHINAYDALYIIQNARVVKNAERFYRKAISHNSASWNSRVEHMFVTLLQLMNHHGTHAKSVVWAHNTHIGDASFTIMQQFGQYNIGQLVREYYGEENVLLVGFWNI